MNISVSLNSLDEHLKAITKSGTNILNVFNCRNVFIHRRKNPDRSCNELLLLHLNTVGSLDMGYMMSTFFFQKKRYIGTYAA